MQLPNVSQQYESAAKYNSSYSRSLCLSAAGMLTYMHLQHTATRSLPRC
jgi:hypothetical protein